MMDKSTTIRMIALMAGFVLWLPIAMLPEFEGQKQAVEAAFFVGFVLPMAGLFLVILYRSIKDKGWRQ